MESVCGKQGEKVNSRKEKLKLRGHLITIKVGIPLFLA